MDTSSITNYDSGQGMFLLLILLFVYFIPGIVGFSKGKNSAGAIFLLNLFLGWSFIGWVVALIWAAANDPKTNAIPPAKREPTRIESDLNYYIEMLELVPDSKSRSNLVQSAMFHFSKEPECEKFIKILYDKIRKIEQRDIKRMDGQENNAN